MHISPVLYNLCRGQQPQRPLNGGPNFCLYKQSRKYLVDIHNLEQHLTHIVCSENQGPRYDFESGEGARFFSGFSKSPLYLTNSHKVGGHRPSALTRALLKTEYSRTEKLNQVFSSFSLIFDDFSKWSGQKLRVK